MALSGGDVDEAIRMAGRLEASYDAPPNRGRFPYRGGRRGWQGRPRRGYNPTPRPRKDELNALDNKERKKVPPRPVGTQGRKCYLCGGDHVVRDCPKLPEAKKHLN